MKTDEIPDEAWIYWHNEFATIRAGRPLAVSRPKDLTRLEIDNLPRLSVSADGIDYQPRDNGAGLTLSRQMGRSHESRALVQPSYLDAESARLSITSANGAFP